MKAMGITLQKPLSLHTRGILFDMDGVLISGTASDERCWLRWARFHNMEGAFSIQSTHGRRALDTLHALRPDLDAAIELKRLEDFDADFTADDHNPAPALPGAKSLLASLPANTWTIVTSASERLMRDRIHAAGITPPHRIVSADHVSLGKPHPEPYATGARILGLPPSGCLVIEDSPAGVQSGKAAGCSVLAVLTSHTAADLSAADWIIPSLNHITATPTPNNTLTLHLIPNR